MRRSDITLGKTYAIMYDGDWWADCQARRFGPRDGSHRTGLFYADGDGEERWTSLNHVMSLQAYREKEEAATRLYESLEMLRDALTDELRRHKMHGLVLVFDQQIELRMDAGEAWKLLRAMGGNL